MENKHLIIILLVIIAVLAVAIAAAFLPNSDAKEPCMIKITSDKTLTEGDELSVELTDFNNTPLSKQIVNITVTDKEGKVAVDDVVKTDSQGKAKLNPGLKSGKYVVNASYGGNDNFTANSTSQNLTVEEEVVEAESASSDSDSSDEYVYSPQNERYYKASGDWEKDDAGNDVYTYQGDDGVLYQRYYDPDGNEISAEDYFR